MANAHLQKRGESAILEYLNSYIGINGNKYAVIQGCKKILECSEILVRVNTSKYIVHVWGEGLKVYDFKNDNIKVSGIIKSVEIMPRGKS